MMFFIRKTKSYSSLTSFISYKIFAMWIEYNQIITTQNGRQILIENNHSVKIYFILNETKCNIFEYSKMIDAVEAKAKLSDFKRFVKFFRFFDVFD